VRKDINKWGSIRMNIFRLMKWNDEKGKLKVNVILNGRKGKIEPWKRQFIVRNYPLQDFILCPSLQFTLVFYSYSYTHFIYFLCFIFSFEYYFVVFFFPPLTFSCLSQFHCFIFILYIVSLLSSPSLHFTFTSLLVYKFWPTLGLQAPNQVTQLPFVFSLRNF
jgi:hypothetical protein